MEHLPLDICNLILEFHGYHIYRNGKYMKRLHKNDMRYNVLKQIAIAKKNSFNSYDISFWKNITDQTIAKNYNMCCIIDSIIFDSYVLWRMNITRFYDYDKNYNMDRIQYIIY